MSDKKLGLDKLKVQSFVTSFSKDTSQTIKGGDTGSIIDGNTQQHSVQGGGPIGICKYQSDDNACPDTTGCVETINLCPIQ